MDVNIDNVNHPAHYASSTGMEAIDVIESFTEELRGAEATCTGNILKYVLRWKKKNGLEDLKKARWYLNRLIEKLEPPVPHFDFTENMSVNQSSKNVQ